MPLLRFLADRDDVVDVVLSPPRLEDIFLGYYDVDRDSHGEAGATPLDLPTAEEALRR
jgi:hypothetical protein